MTTRERAYRDQERDYRLHHVFWTAERVRKRAWYAGSPLGLGDFQEACALHPFWPVNKAFYGSSLCFTDTDIAMMRDRVAPHWKSCLQRGTTEQPWVLFGVLGWEMMVMLLNHSPGNNPAERLRVFRACDVGGAEVIRALCAWMVIHGNGHTASVPDAIQLLGA